MKANSLRNLWNSITRSLSRTNTRRCSNLSRGGRKDTSRRAEASKTPDPTGCETNLSAISDLTSDPREEDWPTDDSFVMEPDFSDPMSDDASEKYQAKPVARTTDDIGGSADETGSQTHTSKWLLDLPSAVTPYGVDDTGAWPNSNKTKEDEVEMSCLNATGQFEAPSTASEGTAHTTEVLQQMSYIGGMDYARARLQEATAPRASGKGKQVRPPALLALTSTTGPHGDSRSSSPSSKAASARSSAYRAVHEAAKARKALLDAQIGVKQAASQLSERKARCDREHQSIMEEIEAVQAELRTSTERQAQGHEIQAARMDAMGYRMAEMKDMVTEREVRMEAQLQEVCSQIQAMGTMLKNIQPRPAPASNTIKELLQDTDVSLPKPMKSVSLKPKESVTTATNPSGSKQHLARYAPLPQPLVSNGEAASTSTKFIPSAVSTKYIPPTTKAHKKEPTCEVITIDTSSKGITGLREPTRTNELTEVTSTFQTANATLGESAAEFQTADDGLPPGNPCASSTRRREVTIPENTDDSVNSTRGSSIPPPAITEEAPISPEQLRFTEAISKAMSKELAPLIANRDQTRVRPTVYKGTKDGTVDGWLPVMKRFLERVHAKSPKIDKAWAIIDHLEGEARNYIINKSEPERDEPDKVFSLLASRFGTGGNRMHVRQTFMSRVQQEKEDWMQFLDALEGLRTQKVSQTSLSLLVVMKSCNVL